MRDYSNMPKLNWQDDKPTLAKIKAQVMREEPLVLMMPEGFRLDVDASACGCTTDSTLLLECEPKAVMAALAGENNSPDLNEIGTAIDTARLVVDVDIEGRRLIIHD